MTALITLTTAGTNSGPFDLYSNVDGFTIPFALSVTRAQLQAGFPSNNVPVGTAIVRVKSVGVCTNFVDIPLPGVTTTTTSSTTIGTTFAHSLSAPFASAALACPTLTFPTNSNASTNPIVVGTIIRNNPSNTLFVGGNNWYIIPFPTAAMQINNSGVVVALTPC